MVPVPKTTPPKLIEDDLHPMSLTSQVSKIMKSFTLDSLLSQIIGNLDNKQCALPKKSGTHAMLWSILCIKSMLLLTEVIVQQDYFSHISRRHLI